MSVFRKLRLLVGGHGGRLSVLVAMVADFGRNCRCILVFEKGPVFGAWHSWPRYLLFGVTFQQMIQMAKSEFLFERHWVGSGESSLRDV